MEKYKNRYSLSPQMREYDHIGENWIPFIMFMQKPNYKSTVVNTDQYGFRFNSLENKKKNIFEDNFAKKIVIGNSVVFGVGTSGDDRTISSILSKKTGHTYLNFGGRAFSSFQEITLFNYFLDKLKFLDEIIIINGINDLFLINQSKEYYYLDSLMYNKRKFTDIMNKPRKTFKSKILDILNFQDQKNFLPKSNVKGKEIMEQNIERNIYFWHLIQKSLNVKIKVFLQPSATWCKSKLSSEEDKIFNELDRYHYNNKIQKFLSNDDHITISRIYETNCKKYNIDYLDLNKHLANFNSEKNWLFVDRVHLTDNGYEKISDIILRKY